MLENDSIAKEWLSRYETKNTTIAAKNVLIQYEKYLVKNSLSNTDYLNLLKKDEATMFRMINQFVISLDLAPSSIRQSFSFFKSFLRWNGIKITIEDRKDFIKFKKIEKIKRIPLTREIIKSICNTSNQFYKTLFLIQASSGNRISETLSLKKEDFNFNSDPIYSVIQAKHTKTKEERLSFISKEAFTNLQKFGIDEFFNTEKKLNAVEWYFWKIRNELKLNERYSNGFHHVNIHSFRAYFRTMAIKANLNQDMSEALIGHSGYLKQYIRPEDNDLKIAYKKLEPHLRIF